LPQVSPFTITNPKRRKRPSDKNPEISKLKKISFRTLKQIENYIVSAQDGKLGKVDDLILDTETWEIRYIKVDAKQKQLMLPPQWVDQLHPIDKVLSTKLEKDLVLSGPYAIGQPAN
jgi:sporulation protein YlmC with PRC-barrel domain